MGKVLPAELTKHDDLDDLSPLVLSVLPEVGTACAYARCGTYLYIRWKRGRGTIQRDLIDCPSSLHGHIDLQTHVCARSLMLPLHSGCRWDTQSGPGRHI